MDKYSLMFGDCLQLLQSIKDKSINAIITDLPYGTTSCAWDEIIPLDKMWEQSNRLLKKTGPFVTTANQPFASKLVMSNIDNFKYDWVWEKNRPSGFYIGNLQPLRRHEGIYVFCQSVELYNPQMLKRTPEEFRSASRENDAINHFGEQFGKGKRNLLKRKPLKDQWYKLPNTVLEFDKDDKRDGSQHPTQKPISLYEYLVKTYTNEGDTVLDFCMGSGTTGEACMILGRKFIGIEKEKRYFDIAEKRIKKAALNIPMFTDV